MTPTHPTVHPSAGWLGDPVAARRDRLVAFAISLSLFAALFVIAWTWVRPNAPAATPLPAHPPVDITRPELVFDDIPITADENPARRNGGEKPIPITHEVVVEDPTRHSLTQAPQPDVDRPVIDQHTTQIPMSPGDDGPGPANFGPRVFEPGELDHAPVPISRVSPEYPPLLRVQGADGNAVVDFIVDAHGNVHDAVALSATMPAFGESAVRALTHWKFRPGIRQGHAVRVHMRIPVVFKLKPGY
jgi:periplasmic protein TonB